MKCFGFILLFTACTTYNHVDPTATTIFKADLYVQQINKNQRSCTHQSVVWGFKSDSICFSIDQVRCFTDAVALESKQHNGHFTAIAISTLKEKHSIRYIVTNNGFIIFITNLERNYPHFVLSTTDICSP